VEWVGHIEENLDDTVEWVGNTEENQKSTKLTYVLRFCADFSTLQRCSERVFFIFFIFIFNLKIRRALLAKELLKMDSDKLTSPTYPSIRITEYNGAQGSVTMACPNNIIRPEGLRNNIRDTAVPGVDEGHSGSRRCKTVIWN